MKAPQTETSDNPQDPSRQADCPLHWFDADRGAFEDLERRIADHPAEFFASADFDPVGACATREARFASVDLPEDPTAPQAHADHLLHDVFRHVMPVAAPTFVGHMTSSLPSFMPSLAKIVAALNQNVVKLETSGALTGLERQVIGMMHKLVFGQDAGFYGRWLHDPEHSLGAFGAGGTTANLAALWASRNQVLRARDDFAGIHRAGLAAALRHYGYDGLAIVVSERGHYSLRKAADVLGIGRDNLVPVAVDADGRMRVDALRAALRDLQQRNIRPMTIVGIAGTTETGAVDPLDAIADVAQEAGCHFHVDAAWGGATLLSARERWRFAGIERADSVVIDAHKQFYVPMGAGMVLFRDPAWTQEIVQHANYIVRKGSVDLGRHTLEGSRGAAAVMLYANLHLLGRKGLARLIDTGIDNARFFADLIDRQPDFELDSRPQLCILTYRYVPAPVRAALASAATPAAQRERIQAALDALTISIQEMQRDAGRSFVSRTQLTSSQWDGRAIAVFRVVLANPDTTHAILQDILDEQRALAARSPMLAPLMALL
ncbi:putative pyridoxal-dependent aspartate 1-decarboxylase [Cupriavidus sp. SZY C1]|uniref:pyridoxal-dependent aspartate 1-decarboxylase PanP n=1 Tax=Cupriavidus sp. SZY C1 TaxID=3055037 RepID=UPI0028BCAC6F|nr:putative pyridoxal-dependent aspartate 1-decarboxylase [Cupriavidus sp. SZY C1]MDT6962604.1 putative pyridoxal-dependent aspartate 1-decarboxylase [Cupriavidus sp. SZY C1]